MYVYIIYFNSSSIGYIIIITLYLLQLLRELIQSKTSLTDTDQITMGR